MDKKAYMAAVTDLMLEGWAMLSRTCPNRGCANCVLLGNKAKGEIQCVNCKSFFVAESEAGSYYTEPPTDREPSYDPYEGEGEGAKARARVDKASKRMGELMLQGWSMLADSCPEPGCPGIPLLRRRGATGKGSCVLCNADVFDGSKAVVAPKPGPPPSPAPAVVTPAAAEPAPSPAAKPAAAPVAAASKSTVPLPTSEHLAWQKKRDSVSTKMGAKMLGGWTMLAKTCVDPACRGTPLMAKHGQPTVCVCCDGDGSGVKAGAAIGAAIGAASGAAAGTPVNSHARLDDIRYSGKGSGNGVAVSPQASKHASVQHAQAPLPAVSSLSSSFVLPDQAAAQGAQTQGAPVDQGVDTRGKSDFEVASNCVSARLLEGWSMLADSCDDCDTPLMRYAKHQGGDPVCVNSRCPEKRTAPAAAKVGTMVGTTKTTDYSTDTDDEGMMEGMGFAAAEAAYSKARFGGRVTQPSQPRPSAASSEATPPQAMKINGERASAVAPALVTPAASPVPELSVLPAGVESSMDTARRRALAAVAHKMDQASSALVSSTSQSDDLALSQLLGRLAAAANALERRNCASDP